MELGQCKPVALGRLGSGLRQKEGVGEVQRPRGRQSRAGTEGYASPLWMGCVQVRDLRWEGPTVRCSASHKAEGTAGGADSGPGEQQEHSLGRAPGCLMSCTWQLGQSQVSGPSLLPSRARPAFSQAQLVPGALQGIGSLQRAPGREGCPKPQGTRTFPGRQTWRAVPRLQRRGWGTGCHLTGSAVLPGALLYTEDVGWTEPYRWDGSEEVAG